MHAVSPTIHSFYRVDCRVMLLCCYTVILLILLCRNARHLMAFTAIFGVEYSNHPEMGRNSAEKYFLARDATWSSLKKVARNLSKAFNACFADFFFACFSALVGRKVVQLLEAADFELIRIDFLSIFCFSWEDEKFDRRDFWTKVFEVIILVGKFDFVKPN